VVWQRKRGAATVASPLFYRGVCTSDLGKKAVSLREQTQI
jgi:hypothetical protein